MADEGLQAKLSKIAQGFNTALGGPTDEATSDACPHCGKSASEPVDGSHGDEGKTLGKRIGYPGS